MAFPNELSVHLVEKEEVEQHHNHRCLVARVAVLYLYPIVVL